LSNLNATLQNATIENSSKKLLTQEETDRMFEAYRESLKNEGRAVLYNQVMQMQAFCAAEDEIRLISSTEITDSYAQSLRNELMELFSKLFGRQLRITTELQEQAAPKEDQPKVLSKQELFNELNKRNPMLGQLRDGLNLQIDY